jgi:siroheme synthase
MLPLPTCGTKLLHCTTLNMCHHGVTTCIAESSCALFVSAGLPLTDAKLAGAYAVVSAHDAGAVNWAAFSAIPTLVILMGGRALPVIVQQLQATGWADNMPVSAAG